MLHHSRQLDRERLRELGHGRAVFTLKSRQNCPARPIHQRRESTVEPPFVIVHHVVYYADRCVWCQSRAPTSPRLRNCNNHARIPRELAPSRATASHAACYRRRCCRRYPPLESVPTSQVLRSSWRRTYVA